MNNNTDGIEARPSPIHGTGLFTKRIFGAGSILASIERPLIANLPWALENACSWCCIPDFDGCSLLHHNGPLPPKLSSCGKCRTVKYCSKACQAAHWKNVHKGECKILARQHMPMPNAMRVVIQVLQGIERDEPAYKALLERETGYDVLRRQWGGKWGQICGIADEAFRQAGTITKSDTTTARKAACLCITGGMQIFSAQADLIGDAQDPLLNTINHSCKPNAAVVWDGPKCTIRALESMAADEEILISYINQNLFNENDVYDWRQAILKHRHYFTCKCSKCVLGRDGPSDKWLKPLDQMTPDAQSAADEMMPGRPTPAGPQSLRPPGRSKGEKRAACLEAIGYDRLRAAENDLDPEKASDELCGCIGLLASSGIFARGRAPLPGMYDKLHQCLQNIGEKTQMLMVGMKIHFVIDPVVYPQPWHPKRVLHTWNLCSTALGMYLESTTGMDDFAVLEPLEDLGITMIMLFAGLLKELKETVPKSYGMGSQMMEVVNMKWRQVTDTGSFVQSELAANNLNPDQWHGYLQAKIPEVLKNAAKVARESKMTPGGLTVPVVNGKSYDVPRHSRANAGPDPQAMFEEMFSGLQGMGFRQAMEAMQQRYGMADDDDEDFDDGEDDGFEAGLAAMQQRYHQMNPDDNDVD